MLRQVNYLYLQIFFFFFFEENVFTDLYFLYRIQFVICYISSPYEQLFFFFLDNTYEQYAC